MHWNMCILLYSILQLINLCDLLIQSGTKWLLSAGKFVNNIYKNKPHGVTLKKIRSVNGRSLKTWSITSYNAYHEVSHHTTHFMKYHIIQCLSWSITSYTAYHGLMLIPHAGSMFGGTLNTLKTSGRLLYLKNQFVPCCKHFYSWL
jgi:hypothetical protein